MPQQAPEKKRRQPNGHEAFADLDDEPLQRTKRPERKAEQDFDMVGAVLNNLRRPDSGPPRKQLKIKFNDVRLHLEHAQTPTITARMQIMAIFAPAHASFCIS